MLNIYEYLLLKKNLVAIDRCSVYNLLGQRTTPEPSDLLPLLPGNSSERGFLSSFREEFENCMIQIHMSTLHCNTKYELTRANSMYRNKEPKGLPLNVDCE